MTHITKLNFVIIVWPVLDLADATKVVSREKMKTFAVITPYLKLGGIKNQFVSRLVDVQLDLHTTGEAEFLQIWLDFDHIVHRFDCGGEPGERLFIVIDLLLEIQRIAHHSSMVSCTK